MVKNPPANAGNTGSSPRPGRCHMPQSNKARVPQLLKPAHLEPVLGNKSSHRDEQPAHRNQEWPPLAAIGESPRAATKTQRSQK